MRVRSNMPVLRRWVREPARRREQTFLIEAWTLEGLSRRAGGWKNAADEHEPAMWESSSIWAARLWPAAVEQGLWPCGVVLRRAATYQTRRAEPTMDRALQEKLAVRRQLRSRRRLHAAEEGGL